MCEHQLKHAKKQKIPYYAYSFLIEEKGQKRIVWNVTNNEREIPLMLRQAEKTMQKEFYSARQ